MVTFKSIAADAGIPVAEILKRFDLEDYDPDAELRPDIADGVRAALISPTPEPTT